MLMNIDLEFEVAEGGEDEGKGAGVDDAVHLQDDPQTVRRHGHRTRHRYNRYSDHQMAPQWRRLAEGKDGVLYHLKEAKSSQSNKKSHK